MPKVELSSDGKEVVNGEVVPKFPNRRAPELIILTALFSLHTLMHTHTHTHTLTHAHTRAHTHTHTHTHSCTHTRTHTHTDTHTQTHTHTHTHTHRHTHTIPPAINTEIRSGCRGQTWTGPAGGVAATHAHPLKLGLHISTYRQPLLAD